MDVTTKARVQAILSSGGQTATPLDTLLPGLISDVSGRFEQYLGRAFGTIARTETFDVDPTTTRFFLEAYPVASVATVEYDPDRAFGAAGTLLVENDDFVLDAKHGIVFVEGFGFYPYRLALEIVYTGGLGETTAELIGSFPDLAHAADLQVAYLAQRRQDLGAAGIAAGGGSSSFVGAYELLPEVKSILDLHRRRGF